MPGQKKDSLIFDESIKVISKKDLSLFTINIVMKGLIVGVVIDANAPSTSYASRIVKELSRMFPLGMYSLDSKPSYDIIVKTANGNMHVPKKEYHNHIVEGDKVQINSNYFLGLRTGLSIVKKVGKT